MERRKFFENGLTRRRWAVIKVLEVIGRSGLWMHEIGGGEKSPKKVSEKKKTVDSGDVLNLSQSMNAVVDSTRNLVSARLRGEKMDWWGEKNKLPNGVEEGGENTADEYTDEEAAILTSMGNPLFRRWQ